MSASDEDLAPPSGSRPARTPSLRDFPIHHEPYYRQSTLTGSGDGDTPTSNYTDGELDRLAEGKDPDELLEFSRTRLHESAVRHQLSYVEGRALTIVVIGASGHLARTKTYPALASLLERGLIPKSTIVVGYARSKMDQQAFHDKISPKLSGDEQKTFLSQCTYVSGQYDSADDFTRLTAECEKREKTAKEEKGANRIFYFAIPPSVFADVAVPIKQHCLSRTGWNRIIVEKPFGRDSASSEELSEQLLAQFTEDQLYRIDHYLGKEVVQNMLVLRFSNLIFAPAWNRDHISNVVITFKENSGVEGRGGYFDRFGIIRDVMQNHLMQILCLVAMEPPVSLSARDIRDEKVKVLRAIEPLDLDDIVIGQYTEGMKGDEHVPGYTQDESVPDDSNTPTFATAVLYVKNPRWDGIPFILKAAKGVNERKAEVRIQFKNSPGKLFPRLPRNELVMRVQPNEAIYLKLLTKSPGLSEQTEQTELDLTYGKRFTNLDLPDAYERLILDVVRGDHRLFVRNDELVEAWRIFTPILHKLEDRAASCIPYKFGTRGPTESDRLAAAVGFERNDTYRWRASM